MQSLDIHETADILKVHRDTVEELAKMGELRGAKIGRSWVFIDSDIFTYLQKQIDKQTRERQERYENNEPYRSTPAAKTTRQNRRQGRPRNNMPDLSKYQEADEAQAPA